MLENMLISKFMGVGPENIIQIDKSLTKRPGDQMTFRIIPPLSNSGGGDDSDIEGNEESLNAFNFPITIHERNNGVRSAGIMTDKRTAINIRREATVALGNWAAEQVENDLIYALSGLGNQNTYAGEGTSDIETVNEKAPSTNRIFYGGQTVAGVVTSESSDSALGDGGAADYANYLFGTKIIDIAKRKAQMASPKFGPIMINGKGYYVMFIHPLQTKGLQAETSAVNSWSAIQAAANVRGINNPLFGKQGAGRDRIFDGAVGVWNDVILYELDRIQTRVAGEVFDNGDTIDTNVASGTARVARALLCGAQAGVIGWGKNWKRHEKDFDYGRKPGTAIDGIYGASKTRFNDPGADQNTNTAQEDFAVIAVDTCVAED